MASTSDKAVVALSRMRRGASGLMAVMGTVALAFASVQQFSGQGFLANEVWLVGLMVAVTFEAIATFFRPQTSGTQMSIWSLTLIGCSCVCGGFAMKQSFFAALGIAMVLAGFAMAVFLPIATTAGQPPGTSDNAAR
jgi:hypothetical protein